MFGLKINHLATLPQVVLQPDSHLAQDVIPAEDRGREAEGARPADRQLR
jgi:hypothetical protein